MNSPAYNEDDETPIGRNPEPRPETPASRLGTIGVGLAGAGLVAIMFSVPLGLGLFAAAIVVYGIFYVIKG